jgi:hypothetical protein
MSGRQPTPKPPKPPMAPPIQPPSKKKVKIRRDKKWVEVDVDEEIRKGRFRYMKFVDDDGLDTYWISPE